MEPLHAADESASTAAPIYAMIYYQNSLGENIMRVACRSAEEYEAEKRMARDWILEQVCQVSTGDACRCRHCGAQLAAGGCSNGLCEFTD
jgi:hypothetical protein